MYHVGLVNIGEHKSQRYIILYVGGRYNHNNMVEDIIHVVCDIRGMVGGG